jgi:hypothetical protein
MGLLVVEEERYDRPSRWEMLTPNCDLRTGLYHLWSLFIDIAIDIANYRNRQFINLSFYFILYLSLGIVIRAPYVLPTATSLEPVVEMLEYLPSLLMYSLRIVLELSVSSSCVVYSTLLFRSMNFVIFLLIGVLHFQLRLQNEEDARHRDETVRVMEECAKEQVSGGMYLYETGALRLLLVLGLL